MGKYDGFAECPRGMPDWQHENGSHTDVWGICSPFVPGRVYCVASYALLLKDGPPKNSYKAFRPMAKSVYRSPVCDSS